jgi:exodeoxyribonuclease VII large subunit
VSTLPLFFPYTVEALTDHIKMLLESDETLQDVWVEGEVSNFSRPQSGHCYFSLKGGTARIQCVIWRSAATRLPTLPQNGDKVLAHGQVGVYGAQGVYQLYVAELLPAGLGAWYIQFERLKAQLQAEGLFAAERKRPLPAFPRGIGIVTSPTGAAIRDILHVIRRRFPCTEVVISPTMVQGSEAPDQIVTAIERLNSYTDCQVLILARGGGSLEELQPFNDERVARAIYASRIPVVSGVGHETDVTIADMVADTRAPTPTAAAEVVTPDREELMATLYDTQERLNRVALRRISESATALSYFSRALRQASPQNSIATYRQRTDDYLRTLSAASVRALARADLSLGSLAQRLETLNPTATLARGYAIVSLKETGRIVWQRRHVQKGDNIIIRVSDGSFGGQVTDKPQTEEAEVP